MFDEIEDMSVDSVAELLLRAYDLIEQDKQDEVYKVLSKAAQEHPEWVDARFQAELKLLTRQMENRMALNEFGFLRSISLAYRLCEADYSSVGLTVRDRDDTGKILPEHDTVWWSWLQGLERAPEIVKCCYRSLGKLGKKIIILDEDNITDYVKLPDHIVEKYRAGLIGKAHYSDLVRLELLTTLGGCWIDATTYISGTDQILPLLNDEELFMYRSGNVSEYIIFDNWFILAKKKSAILEATKRMLYAFWEKEDKVSHYFICHLMMTMACRQYPEEYKSIPAYSNEPAHILQYELGKTFSAKRMAQIKAMSDVHKLTYKLDDIKDTDGTFLGQILNTM